MTQCFPNPQEPSILVVKTALKKHEIISDNPFSYEFPLWNPVLLLAASSLTLSWLSTESCYTYVSAAPNWNCLFLVLQWDCRLPDRGQVLLSVRETGDFVGEHIHASSCIFYCVGQSPRCGMSLLRSLQANHLDFPSSDEGNGCLCD